MTTMGATLWLLIFIACLLGLGLAINGARAALASFWAGLTGAVPPIESTDWRTFVEPGSGLTMRRGHWYILSDSGSCYTAQHFPTANAACSWCVGRFTEGDGFPSPSEITYAHYRWATHDWEDMGACNVLFADHLRDFWLHDDPHYLAEVQANPKPLST